MTSSKKHKAPQTGPVALVTGAASPLGTAICFKLAEQGTHLALHFGRSQENTLKLQRNLKKFRIETLVLRANFGKSTQIESLIGQITQKWGRLDLLVNNASLFQPSLLTVKSWAKWTEIFQVNALSPCLLTTAAFPWLRKTNGSVVNITDIYGEQPILKNYPGYSVSKAALIFLTKYLALEFSPHVRVNAVSPGVITFPKDYKKIKKKELIQKTALRREGTPEEIADAVLFLTKNKFVTGQILKVDGGRFIY